MIRPYNCWYYNAGKFYKKVLPKLDAYLLSISRHHWSSSSHVCFLLLTPSHSHMQQGQCQRELIIFVVSHLSPTVLNCPLSANIPKHSDSNWSHRRKKLRSRVRYEGMKQSLYMSNSWALYYRQENFSKSIFSIADLHPSIVEDSCPASIPHQVRTSSLSQSSESIHNRHACLDRFLDHGYW